MKLRIKNGFKENHKKHEKKICYVRDQANGKNVWTSLDVYLCSCGAVLRLKEEEL